MLSNLRFLRLNASGKLNVRTLIIIIFGTIDLETSQLRTIVLNLAVVLVNESNFEQKHEK